MKKIVPDERLRAAAAFVRQGAVFADIGTDHAYLPVFLCKEGRVSRAYACDIVEGPLAAATAHIAENGLEGSITPVLTDGLTGLDNLGITDIAICGMGGELIVDILSHAPFVKDPRVRLILQPMTRVREVRAYLAREGFAILDECVRRVADKLYFCFVSEYTGVPYTLSRLEEELGAINMRREPPEEEFLALLAHKLAAAERRVEGLLKGKRDATEEQVFLDALRALTQTYKGKRI